MPLPVVLCHVHLLPLEHLLSIFWVAEDQHNISSHEYRALYPPRYPYLLPAFASIITMALAGHNDTRNRLFRGRKLHILTATAGGVRYDCRFGYVDITSHIPSISRNGKSCRRAPGLRSTTERGCPRLQSRT